MAYDEKAAQKLRDILNDVSNVSERKMMGSLIFMVNDHMCCGITGDSLMVRVGPDAHAAAIKEMHVGPMDIGGGRQPRAFVRVEPEGFRSKKAMTKWVDRGIAFVETLPAKKPKKARTMKAKKKSVAAKEK